MDENLEYVPLAEHIARIEAETPDRFKRDVGPLRNRNHQKWADRRKATTPRAPKFATDQRVARLRNQRAEAKEKKKKPERKVAGAPNLRTTARAAFHPDPEPEKFNTNFKARAAPSSTRSAHRVVSTNSSLASSSSTTFKPFSFDSRPTKKKEIVIPEPTAKVYHKPGALPMSIDRPSGVPERVSKKTTTAKAFNFSTAARSQNVSRISFTDSNVSFGQGHKATDERSMRRALKEPAAIARSQKAPTRPVTVSIQISNSLEYFRYVFEGLTYLLF